MAEKRSVYALMIGIDDYPVAHHKLRGCVNDMRAVKAYIETQFDKENFDLKIKTLENQEATRANIIDGFLKHLTQAKPTDIIFVHYSGHGSQEAAAPEFWHIEPDQLNESMVCWDSRINGGFDLVDKEQAYIMHKLAATGAHVVALYDCCHSGSGTRGADGEVRSRMAEVGNASRGLEQYLGWNEYDIKMEGGKRLATPPTGRHILLAAAKDSQTAKETNIDGAPGGVFTNSLLHVLKTSSGTLSYAEVMARVQTYVFNRVDDQNPQLDAPFEENDKFRAFLDGSILPKPCYYTASYDKAYSGWVIDAGNINGIPMPTSGESAEFAIFDQNASDKDLLDDKKSMATVKVKDVFPDKSVLNTDGLTLDEKRNYKAKVTKLPLPRIKIFIDGEEAGVKAAIKAIDAAKTTYFQRVTDSKEARYRVLAKGKQYYVTLPKEEKPLFKRINEYTEDSAKLLVQRLEHIGQWVSTFERSNPSTALTGQEIELTLTEIEEFGQRLAVNKEKQIKDSDATLEYKFDSAKKKWSTPWVRLKLKNVSTETFFVSLVYLGADFSANTDFLPMQELKPGQEVYIRNKIKIQGRDFETNAIGLRVPDEFTSWGTTQISELFKVMISTVSFDSTHFKQEGLELDMKKKVDERVAVSDFDDFGSGFSDWTVRDIHFTLIRPLDSVDMGTEGVQMHGVKIAGHPAFAGKVNLASQPEATRAAGGTPVAPKLLDGNAGITDFAFNDPTGKAAPLSVLELSDIKDKNVVNSEAPLELAISQHIPDNEMVMAVAYDEELGLFIPVGGMDRDASGNATVRIDQLPSPTPAGTRSLGGSIKILFKRVVLEKIGIKSEYPLLQEGVASPDGETLTYKPGAAHVAKRVAESQRIVMFIHGIIGDTKDMAKSLRKAKLNIDGTDTYANDLYDLVLTFDYENLGTPIEENGRLLKQRLEEVGLGAGHNKTFHIVAHSMGGLVSRWFIEKEGGNKMVSHLIQLGTPNAGSELGGTPRNWAKVGLTTLMGKATLAMPFLAPISGLMCTFTESMLHSLGQMAPDSDFIKNLNDGTDPGIPYSIIAGNTSLMQKVWDEAFSAKMAKMVQQLQDVLLSALFHAPNDVAVRMESIRSIPENRVPAPIKRIVACDHMSYFVDPEGLRGLAETLFEITAVKAD